MEITGLLTDPAPRMFLLLLSVIIAALAVTAGCGTTESSGKVGDTLSAKGLEVTVQEVDKSVPEPKIDVTGLRARRPESSSSAPACTSAAPTAAQPGRMTSESRPSRAIRGG